MSNETSQSLGEVLWNRQNIQEMGLALRDLSGRLCAPVTMGGNPQGMKIKSEGSQVREIRVS